MHLRFRDFKLAANLELLNRRRFLVKRNVSGRVIGCMVSDLCVVGPYRQRGSQKFSFFSKSVAAFSIVNLLWLIVDNLYLFRMVSTTPTTTYRYASDINFCYNKVDIIDVSLVIYNIKV